MFQSDQILKNHKNMKYFTYSILIFYLICLFSGLMLCFNSFDLDLYRKREKNSEKWHCQKFVKIYILLLISPKNIHFRWIKYIVHYIHIIYVLSFYEEKSYITVRGQGQSQFLYCRKVSKLKKIWKISSLSLTVCLFYLLYIR